MVRAAALERANLCSEVRSEQIIKSHRIPRNIKLLYSNSYHWTIGL